jgi:hypothetical protein
VAGIGAYLFFRRAMQHGFWPSLFGGVAYPLTGFFVMWQYFDVGSTCAWLPWMLLFTDLAVRRPGGYGPIGVACTTAAIVFIGVVVPWPHVLLASGLYALWRLYLLHGPAWYQSRPNLAAMSALALAWGLGIVLTAPQSLPAAEYLQTSHRVAARAKGVLEQPKAGWKTGVEVLFPYHHGDTTAQSVYLPGKGNRLEGAPSAYAGLLTILVLAPWGMINPMRRRENWLWIAAGLFGLLWHANLPFVSDVFAAYPFNLLRHNRFTLYTGWDGIALAVSGIQALLTERVSWHRWFWGPVAVLVFGAFYAGTAYLEMPNAFLAVRLPVQAAWFERVYAAELAMCVLGLFAWRIIYRARRRVHLATFVACGIALGELIYTAWGANPQGDRESYYPRTPITKSLQSAQNGRVCMGRYLSPNMNMMYGCSEIRGYDGADPQRIVKLYRAAQPRWEANIPYAVTQSFDPPRSPIMDMLGLRYVFHPGPPTPSSAAFAQDRFGWIEERRQALPRVFIPRRVEPVADDEQCLERLRSPLFDPRETAYVSGHDLTSPVGEARGAARIVEHHPTQVVVSARMKKPGWLVLADAWAPGWKAFVDGRETPVRRVNYLLRGVELPAKQCTIVFRYEPASFDWGVRIGLTAAGMLAVWCGLVARQRSRDGGKQPIPSETSC